MKLQGFVPQLLKLMDKRQNKKGQSVEFAYVSGRRPVGSSGATYSLTSRGASASGIPAQLGDYEPGQRVMLSRFGANAEAKQILMQAPPSKQATQAPQNYQRDITGETLL